MDKQLCTECDSSEIYEEGIYCNFLDKWVGRCSEQHCVIEFPKHDTDKEAHVDTQKNEVVMDNNKKKM